MSKKIILVLFGIIFFSSHHLAHAGVIINEVQLSPTEERFIELYNTGDLAVNLTNWYIQRKTATGSSFGSLVSKPNFESKIIGARDYFVISRNSLSNSDIILDSLTLTESNTIQIKNSNEEIVDKISWGNASDCINPCPPNPPDSKSLQKISGLWSEAIPTPGITNEIAPPSPGTSSSSASSSTINNASESVNGNIYIPSSVKKQKIKTEILTATLAFAGVPMKFKVNTTGYYGEVLPYGKYFWNFGDGDFKEMKVNEAEKFTHTYFYPGEYDISLAYYMNYYSENPEAIDKIIVKVVEPNISISNVGDNGDFFIEIANDTDYEADISQWIIASDKINFIFPKNTILGPKKKMIISSRISNFSIEDKNTLKLMTPQREVVYDYMTSSASAISNKTAIQPKIVINENSSPIEPLKKPPEEISVENLEASPILSEIKENDDNSRAPAIIFVIFLGIASSTLYFIRQKKSSTPAGNDFELLDE